MQASIPHSQPSPAELADMQHRANYVVRLLEDLRRQMQPDSERVRTDSPVTVRSPDDHRQPKRPWEDMSHDGAAGETEGSYPEVRTGFLKVGVKDIHATALISIGICFA